MQILYVDMDNILVDFPSGIERVAKEVQSEFEGRLDELPGIIGLIYSFADSLLLERMEVNTHINKSMLAAFIRPKVVFRFSSKFSFLNHEIK